MRKFAISDKFINRSEVIIPFLNEIKKYKILTKEEELVVLKSAKAGDQKSMDLLITTNLRFIVSVAKEYESSFHTLADLINVGTIGLIKSIRKFNIDSGLRFLSFGVWGIRGEIFQYINKQLLIAIPYNKITGSQLMHNIILKYTNEFGVLPTPEEIVALSDKKIALKDVKALHSIIDGSTEFIDDPDHFGVVEELSSNKTDTELYEEKEATDLLIESLFSYLTEREIFIVSNYFGLNNRDPITLDEIGKELKLTREGVRKIKVKAINKLKALKIDNGIK